MYEERLLQSKTKQSEAGWRVETISKSETKPKSINLCGIRNSLHPTPQLVYLEPTQKPPECLMDAVFALAADIQTRRAVLSPSPTAAEPLKWDDGNGCYNFV